MALGEAVGLAALRWVASPVIKDVVSKSFSYLGTDMAKGLEDLETTLLPQFQLTIQAALRSPHKDELAKWLARLKIAYYDAEDILHELEYKHLKCRAKADRKKRWVRISSHPIIKPLANVTRKVSQQVSLLSCKKKMLWNQLKKLKEIAAEANTFRDLLSIQSGNENGVLSHKRTFETSAHINHKVFGRNKVRDEIIKFLLDEQEASSSTKSYSVVAITGVGGAGKTTLAQYVYNDEVVKKSFKLRMWLCMSENKDVKERLREIIECSTENKCPNLLNLNLLQNKLKDSLAKFKTILLVLDDVRYDQTEKQWDDLLAPFALIGGRCKIVVTSRNTLFPNTLEPGKLIELPDLEPEDFKSLFRYYAMDGLKLSDPQLKNDLCTIGDQIAAKISKSPLAAKTVGNLLKRSPEKSFWQETRESDNLRSTREVLLWSYEQFDVQLQRCFLFCGVFPKGVYFTAGNELVRYWVALDLFQCTDDNINIDGIGLEYFNMLVACCVFQIVDGKYYMHDLFIDLAKKLSAGDCLRVTNLEREIPIPLTIRYAYVELNNENLEKTLSSICDLRNLRVLILDLQFDTLVNVKKVLRMIFKKFKKLRVLEVRSMGHLVQELPSTVGDLRNLRYLEFWKTSIHELPDSVSQLYHLQYLLLPASIKALPPMLSDLIKLRSIVMYESDYNLVHTLPPVPYLGKLTSLQSLGEFHVSKEDGYNLRQLGSLREIAGSLRIVNLNNVRQKDEAIDARLFDKPKLKRLELVWNESSENGLDLEVIEALQPTADLEYLSIEGYRGSEYPSWFKEGLFLKNVKTLKFYNCSKLTDLPPNLNKSCHHLTDLTVNEFPCLIFVSENELQLDEHQNTLEEDFWLVDGKYLRGQNLNVFDHEIESFKQTGSSQSCPEQLKIIECAAEDLEDIEVELTEDLRRAWWNCHQHRMNFIFRSKIGANKFLLPPTLRVLAISLCCISDGALSDCLTGTAALEELYLEGINTLTSLPSAEVLESLQNLRFLEIGHCWCLRSLGGLHALPNLEKFNVKECWSLQTGVNDDAELPQTLQSISIIGCVVSQAILDSDFPCLQHVAIMSCAGLTSLSFGSLTSLKRLQLVNCPDLSLIHGNFTQHSFIDSLSLQLLPDIIVESVLATWQGCRDLHISSSVMLNKLLLSEKFDTIQNLHIELCLEDAISFEKSDHLLSIKTLFFVNCGIENLPPTLSDFSNLEFIYFINCPIISCFPELPNSVQGISIEGCPVLKERCQPNGPDWQKIQHIQCRYIK
ncbi:hypothetical protein LUZ61_004856 [Rhynchospora tenuis]|uniref:NB-ARC domain-containing protein n=1 Tax=Rhynchospora tenuis TaxID=198213 RepID=A0AAD5ZNK7_9POAL|nr:hypothetical protein LUZ61_004856 [Rhynchospora tenuis]